MSIEFKVLYYFNDTSEPTKCAGQVCQTMEGWYDEFPTRPHGGLCNCPIDPFIGYAHVVYKNFVEEDGGETTFEKDSPDSYENPHPTADMTVTFEFSYEETQSVEVSVSEVMTHFGFTGSMESTSTMTRTIPVTIPPKSKAYITITTSGNVTHYSAEKWLQFDVNDFGMTDAGDTGEIFVENIEGGVMYQQGNQVDVEVKIESL